MNRIALLIVLTAILSGADYYPYDEDADTWPTQTFTVSAWAHTPESDRYVFANNLLERQILIGLSPTEIQSLLGKPSSDGLRTADHFVSYVIKTKGTGFDQVFTLDLDFDATNSRVIKAFIRGD
jgi:hypothetical protein